VPTLQSLTQVAEDQDYLVLDQPESPLPTSIYLNGVAGYCKCRLMNEAWRLAINDGPSLALFQNLYLRNGTFYYVAETTEDREQQLPPIKFIMSAPPNDEGERSAAGDQEFRVVGAKEAEMILGRVAVRLQGASVSQFESLYYVFWISCICLVTGLAERSTTCQVVVVYGSLLSLSVGLCFTWRY